jgi:hypothetical protein
MITTNHRFQVSGFRLRGLFVHALAIRHQHYTRAHEAQRELSMTSNCAEAAIRCRGQN